MEKVLESKVKVRFQDCDPFNHLNNSKYIDYFINAREDQLINHYDLNIYEHVKKFGKGWVVFSSQISYFRPALLMEEVVIESQLVAFTNRVLKVEMKMWNADKTILKSVFWSEFTHFDLMKQKTASHSPELTALFEGVVNPIQQSSFEKRCEELRFELVS
jgi:thioesterase-3